MLYIFTTSRMVRDFYSSFEDDCLPPIALSISSFESKILRVKGLKKASEDRRMLILQEASNFDNFKKLHIPNEFLAFLSNSSYIFRFFEELSAEKKSFEDLFVADVYAEYNEHIQILQELFVRYNSLLKQKGYYDNISLPQLHEINTQYLKRFDKITLFLEGYLSRFEWDIFKEISTFKELEIRIDLNKYNQKMRDFFLLEGINLPQFGHFIVNLRKKSYKSIEKKEQNTEIIYKAFSLRSLQIAYINEQITNFVQNGIKPEEIAIVLSDESFAPLLKAYDYAHNFNFAMGFSFSKTKIYKKLNAILKAMAEDSPLVRESLKYYGIGENINIFRKKWNLPCKYEDFENLLKSLELEFSNESEGIFQNELYHIKTILDEIALKLSQIFRLFLQRLSTISLDDTSGGKIVVLGVLETRGAKYKGVIIPDFNDEYVPKFVSKDMFLSSKIRAHAKLPSKEDRENLQRYFFHQIIHRAEKVAISYVKNESSIKSRFLQALQCTEDTRFHEDSYKSFLLEKNELKNINIPKDIFYENTIFQSPISASRLREFLSCKRGYYIKYIEKISDEDLPNDDLGLNDIGNYLHLALCEVYKNNASFNDAKTLHEALCDSLNSIKHKNSLWLLEKDIWQKRLLEFSKNEMKRFEKGWKAFEFEKKIDTTFEGVKITGIIDRIDINHEGQYCVIDYKSGKVDFADIAKNNDFQLQFYYLLAKSQYENIKEVGYYDLTNANIQYEENMEKRLEALRAIFQEIKEQKEINFSIEKKDCKYSPYKILLGKE